MNKLKQDSFKFRNLQAEIMKGIDTLKMVYYSLCQGSEIQEDLTFQQISVEIKKKLEANYGINISKW